VSEARQLLYGRRHHALGSAAPSGRAWAAVRQLEQRLRDGDRCAIIAALNAHRGTHEQAPAVSQLLISLASDIVEYDPQVVRQQGIDPDTFSAATQSAEVALLVANMIEQLIELLDEGELSESTLDDLADAVDLALLTLPVPGPLGQAQLQMLLDQFAHRWGSQSDRERACELLTSYAGCLHEAPLLDQLASGWAEQMLQPRLSAMVDVQSPFSRARELAYILGFEPRLDPVIVRAYQGRGLLHLAPSRQRTLCGRDPLGWQPQLRGAWAEASDQSRCQQCARLAAGVPSADELADFTVLDLDQRADVQRVAHQALLAALGPEATPESLTDSVRSAANQIVDTVIAERLLAEPPSRQWSRLMESARMPACALEPIEWPVLDRQTALLLLSQVQRIGDERSLRWAAHRVLCQRLGRDADDERKRVMAWQLVVITSPHPTRLVSASAHARGDFARYSRRRGHEYPRPHQLDYSRPALDRQLLIMRRG
jgi:hypothetical protein